MNAPLPEAHAKAYQAPSVANKRNYSHALILFDQGVVRILDEDV